MPPHTDSQAWQQAALQSTPQEAIKQQHLLMGNQTDAFVKAMVAAFPMPPWLNEPRLSVQHLHELLDLTEAASALASQRLNMHLAGLRAAFRQKVLAQHAHSNPECIHQLARILQNTPFPGMQEILARCVYAHFAEQLVQMDQNPALREMLAEGAPRRWVTNDLRRAGETEVAAHNLQLLRLEYPLRQEVADGLMQKIGTGNSQNNRMNNILMRAVHQREPAKYAICRLLEHLGPHHSHSAHNVHPASLLLAEVTGFVMHPTTKDQVLSLCATNTPNGLRQFSNLFISKYLDAVQRQQIQRFVSEAFCSSNPCFEAAAEHLLKLDLEQTNYQTHARPVWSNLVSVEQNADTIVEWVVHSMLPKFTQQNQIQLAQLSHSEIDQLLCGKPYLAFVARHQAAAVDMGLSTLDSSMHGAVLEAFSRYFGG